MLKIGILVCFFACVGQAVAQKAPSPPARLAEITARYKISMLECPSRIWSDFSWRGLQVIFVSKDDGGTWLWEASTDAFRPLRNDQLPRAARGALYQFFEFQGKPTMSLNTNTDFPLDLFELGVHEFFHNQAQASWQRPQGAGGRGTLYPVRWEPRLHRRMILDRLKSYLATSDERELSRAKFWFEKWKTDAPAEALSTTDGYEGSADYVEKMAAAVAKHGCAASEDVLRQEIVALTATSGASVSGQFFALDSEGYEVGGLATLALRFRQSDPRAWAPRFATGATGLDILFENVTATAETAPPELVTQFRDSERRINLEFGKLLDPDISNWGRTDHVRVALNFPWLQSNLQPRFFATSATLSMQLYPFATPHRFLAPDGSSDYRFEPDAVVFGHYSPLCPRLFGYVLVPASALQEQNGLFSLAAPRASGRIQGKIHTDPQGFQYLCAE